MNLVTLWSAIAVALVMVSITTTASQPTDAHNRSNSPKKTYDRQQMRQAALKAAEREYAELTQDLLRKEHMAMFKGDVEHARQERQQQQQQQQHEHRQQQEEQHPSSSSEQ